MIFYFQDMDYNEMEGFEITEHIDNDEYKTIKNWYSFFQDLIFEFGNMELIWTELR